MLNFKLLNSLHSIKKCKGTILAARVYADVKGGKCPCGGSFTDRVPHPDEREIILPRCASCQKWPQFFLIDADAKDTNGNRIRIKIRNTKDEKRLDSITRVAYIFQVLSDELASGTFNIRHYDSAKSKESFIFSNYVEEYLAHQERRLARGEITPKGLHDKKGLIRRELMPHFGKVEIYRIGPAEICRFKELYTTKLRTRDLALVELKALLNQAERDGMVNRAPKFDPIPKAKQRKEIIPMELAIKTIEAMPKQLYRDFYSLLLTYPIRPGELRALSWENVDLVRGKFTIKQHFSNEVLVPGRKSIGADEAAGSITFPMTKEAREIFTRQRSSEVVSIKSFVFLSRFGRHLAEASVWEAWNLARKRVGHKFAPYECRHAAASELYIKTGRDLVRMKEIGGWTNTGTLERYVRDRSDNSELFT